MAEAAGGLAEAAGGLAGGLAAGFADGGIASGFAAGLAGTGLVDGGLAVPFVSGAALATTVGAVAVGNLKTTEAAGARQRQRLELLRTEVAALQELQQQELQVLQMQMTGMAQASGARAEWPALWRARGATQQQQAATAAGAGPHCIPKPTNFPSPPALAASCLTACRTSRPAGRAWRAS